MWAKKAMSHVACRSIAVITTSNSWRSKHTHLQNEEKTEPSRYIWIPTVPLQIIMPCHPLWQWSRAARQAIRWEEYSFPWPTSTALPHLHYPQTPAPRGVSMSLTFELTVVRVAVCRCVSCWIERCSPPQAYLHPFKIHSITGSRQRVFTNLLCTRIQLPMEIAIILLIGSNFVGERVGRVPHLDQK